MPGAQEHTWLVALDDRGEDLELAQHPGCLALRSRQSARTTAGVAAALALAGGALVACGYLQRAARVGAPRVAAALLEGRQELALWEETECHTALTGEKCYSAVDWGMKVGWRTHPEWYPGLDNRSSFDDFQLHLYNQHGQDGCPLPCHGTRLLLTVPASLLCFSLIQPHGYERDLLALQYKEGASLFACDEHHVFSDRAIQIAPGLSTSVVNTSLVCGRTEAGTNANMDIFLAVWRRVRGLGAFERHDWTIKIDPDCVFFPGRLKVNLQRHPERPDGVYIANCERGLHEAFEAFSRNAVRRMTDASIDECKGYFLAECRGHCNWSEDLFMDRCLSEILGVDREAEFNLLVEDTCNPPDGWESCKDHTRVGFHPMKDFELYYMCLMNAKSPLDSVKFK